MDTLDTGTYVDGTWGHYTTARAYLILRAWGWEPDTYVTSDPNGTEVAALDSIASHYIDDPDAADAIARRRFGTDAHDILVGAVEEGERWAQSIAPAGTYVGPMDEGDGWGVYMLEVPA